MAAGWAALDGDAFELDAMLPEQYHDRVAEWTPEQNLMAAILRDAASCFFRGADPEVDGWFFAAASGWLYDFLYICDVLGVNADDFRRRLIERRRKDMPT
jgi:hypothetical protein